MPLATRVLAILALASGLSSPALAQAPTAPTESPPQKPSDWPCKQVRVPEIALGGVWSGPSLDAERKAWRDDPAIADLVARIAPRRTALEEAEKLIAEFAKAAGDKRRARLTLLFAGLYERLNDERREVVNGLERFGRRLAEMANTVRGETDALRELQGRTPPDPEAVRKAAEALQWRLRIYDEQRRMTQFVCESPALIEQRFGALARSVQNAME